MTSLSDRRVIRLPLPEGSKTASAYARFIPREELQDFRAWQPGSFGTEPPRTVREATAASPVESWRTRLQAERQEGYQEGYRDGLAALEGFKKSYVAQTSGRVGQLVESFDAQLAALEEQMAQSLARAAVLLARQVLREELQLQPERVASIAHEAVGAMVSSARQIVVRVHPDDLPLVNEGAGEALQARSARLLPDLTVQRGGCRVESDAGAVDATIETRWARAAAALGQTTAWLSPDADTAQTSPDDAADPLPLEDA